MQSLQECSHCIVRFVSGQQCQGGRDDQSPEEIRSLRFSSREEEDEEEDEEEEEEEGEEEREAEEAEAGANQGREGAIRFLMFYWFWNSL